MSIAASTADAVQGHGICVSAKRRRLPQNPVELQIRAAVEEAIESGKWSRYALAASSGVAYPVLKNFLDGEADIHISTAGALLHALGYCICPVTQCKRK